MEMLVHAGISTQITVTLWSLLFPKRTFLSHGWSRTQLMTRTRAATWDQVLRRQPGPPELQAWVLLLSLVLDYLKGLRPEVLKHTLPLFWSQLADEAAGEAQGLLMAFKRGSGLPFLIRPLTAFFISLNSLYAFTPLVFLVLLTWFTSNLHFISSF